MRARREYRDRDATEVEVLDALVDRPEDGMTVFELRSHADVSIHDMEEALESLKDDDLIDVDETVDRTVIKPADRVIPDPDDQSTDQSFLDELRDRLPF
ncbi:hypothetical protein SAMN06269185_3033 [Natronoarchaeum philippinense]|uniref:MarR family protein n=1 Tax=Natronoarchaeum philippinense TaxID=558529 RepID=A0A285P7P3_NATPI|nr:DUF6432 family protein [Natronoarchaeum philippinense]SNZ17468.1 hypothetical protein SAMN06269185_3033 [Natronoarchaeum philippinense]